MERDGSIFFVPLDICYKILTDKNTERNARFLRWPAFDTDLLPAKTDHGFKQLSQMGTSGCWNMSKRNILNTSATLKNIQFGKT